MVSKVNGAAYPGVWVERNVAFVKITFSADIRTILAANLRLLGTTTAVGTLTVAESGFGVVESVLVKALKALEVKATILGIGASEDGINYDVMLGHAEGWFAPAAAAATGVIATAQPVVGAQARATTGATTPPNVAVGDIVTVADGVFTFTLTFAKFNALPVGTVANGALTLGPGATPGAEPPGSPTGTAGLYPTTIPHAS
jgi:hypothetical protein